MFTWERHLVCVAEGAADAYVLLAIRPERLASDDGAVTIVWDDGSHQRAFTVTRVFADKPDEFRFRDDRGRDFSLRPMTSKLYADLVREKVYGPELTTDADVRRFYLQPRGW